MSTTTTRGVQVKVESAYVPERSSPETNDWFFAYQVTIENRGEQPVQLRSRHWIITDAMGRVEEVKGAGVVGEQPRLEPGEGFQYVSACPLHTSMGTMEGSYQMVTDDGEAFDAAVGPFALFDPESMN